MSARREAALGAGGLVTVVTAAEMRAIDRHAIEGGIASLRLMERAGEAAAHALQARFAGTLRRGVLVIAGRGNNGGDGLVVGRLLRRRRVRVEVVLVGDRSALSVDAAANLRRLERRGPRVRTLDEIGLDGLLDRVSRAGLIVDALYGTGVRSPLPPRSIAVIEAMNASNAPVVAIDVPSGLDADRGRPLENAVQATLTVTLGFPKAGLLLHPGVALAGELVVADIGIPAASLAAVNPPTASIATDFLPRTLPTRPPDSHKGTYGHVLVVGGSRGKLGAAALAARAALRAGSGLVTVAGAAPDLDVLVGVTPEVMTAPLPGRDGEPSSRRVAAALRDIADGKTAIVLGPGLGTSRGAARLLAEALAVDAPILIDADGLNLLADDLRPLARRKRATLLTPHPGEMSRLSGRSTAEIQADRLASARALAERTGSVVVLKGARTVVAHPDGFAAINPSGNPGMATGGMGDALSGIAGSLLGQGIGAFEAACAAVSWHGLAGDRLAARRGEVGILASDVVEELSATLADMRRSAGLS